MPLSLNIKKKVHLRSLEKSSNLIVSFNPKKLENCEHVPKSASRYRYKSRDEFCADVRQMFINCEVFNEDDSPVGKAGHGMRSFFEMRWTEITGAPPPHPQTHS